MGKSTASCFKIIACGSDSVDHGDLQTPEVYFYPFITSSIMSIHSFLHCFTLRDLKLKNVLFWVFELVPTVRSLHLIYGRVLRSLMRLISSLNLKFDLTQLNSTFLVSSFPMSVYTFSVSFDHPTFLSDAEVTLGVNWTIIIITFISLKFVAVMQILIKWLGPMLLLVFWCQIYQFF